MESIKVFAGLEVKVIIISEYYFSKNFQYFFHTGHLSSSLNEAGSQRNKGIK